MRAMPSAIVAVGFMGFFFTFAHACGPSFEKPHAHFDGVDEQGHVLYTETLGELDLGDEKLPLFVLFKSNWTAISPYVGAGWMFALLESKIVQQDENTFVLWQPDGWYRMFWRDKENKNILNGQGGWKAAIDGNTITAWASCGWKMVFNQGKISSLTTSKRHRLDYVYSQGRVSEIQQHSRPVLQVVTASASNEVSAILIGDKRIGVELGDKPRVQSANGQSVIAGIEQTLCGIRLADGTEKAYEFAVTQSIHPTLKVCGASERIFEWHPQSFLAVADSAQGHKWQYEIKPGANLFANAEIARKDYSGRTEYWYRDSSKEVTRSLDGRTTTKSWFSSGALLGKCRLIEEEFNGKRSIKYQAFYNEEGQLVRVRKGGFTAQFDSALGRMKVYSADTGALLWDVVSSGENRFEIVSGLTLQN
jgi:hypothetical protein